ncbi:hypothetical protein JOJ87_001426 [Rhodococcus ruber]|uniref:DUF5361 domain-containing protein n=1 Tax=Rhodococcus ruber TaxID=1830 RepID=UPI001AE4808E|nr:DUF5361 domain-containing protein [Rhodococcus ruber]MBP2211082.1 hypothetical protein [Rhodococcus ruber]
MGRELGSRPGGILGLLALLEEHSEAVEYDLIRMGLRLDWLGTDDLTWRDLHVLVRQSGPDSALVRALNPDSRWDLHALLLAEAVDTLHDLRWMKTKDGHKNRNRPKPIPRPGVEIPEDEQVIGEAIEMDDLDTLLGW